MRRQLLIPVALFAAVAGAQTSGPGTPVDQAVADLDILSTSLRRVDTSIYTGSARLFEPDDGVNGGRPVHHGPYLYTAPGVRAWVDRPEYLVLAPDGLIHRNVAPVADGAFVEVIGPNTVFDLVPPFLRPVPNESAPAADDLRIDYRLEMRLDLQLEYRVDRPRNGLFNPWAGLGSGATPDGIGCFQVGDLELVPDDTTVIDPVDLLLAPRSPTAPDPEVIATEEPSDLQPKGEQDEPVDPDAAADQ